VKAIANPGTFHRLPKWWWSLCHILLSLMVWCFDQVQWAFS